MVGPDPFKFCRDRVRNQSISALAKGNPGLAMLKAREVHNAVLKLRKAGYHVYRFDDDHLIDGKLKTTEELFMAAACLPPPRGLS